MKKIFLLACLLATVAGQAQTLTGERVVAKQGIYLRDAWIDSVERDTAFMNRVRSLPTSDAVRRFVEGRINAIPPADWSTLLNKPATFTPAAGSGNYIQNQSLSAQNANAWINGNFRSDGNINLFGTIPRINFYEPDSRYSLYRTGTQMVLSSGSEVDVVSGIGGAIKIKQNTTDKIGVEADGSVRFYAPIGLLAQAVAPTSPSPLNGYMYYDNTLPYFRGYRNGAWKNFTMEGDAVASTNGTHTGLLTLTNTPIIRATNTTLLIDGNSSAGNVVISGSMTGPGVTIKKPGGEGQILRLYDEVAEPTAKNSMYFGYKRTANYFGDIFAGFTGYFSSVNMIQIPLSNFGGGTGADNTKGWWVDFYPLGQDGITPTIWRKVNGTTVWKEYGTKTELYPDVDANTNFTIGAKTIKITNLPTYADDAAAGAAGLQKDVVYKTSTGQLMIKL